MPDKWPVAYDSTLGESRPVTQADVDKWVRLEQTYGRMLEFMRTEHAKLVKSICTNGSSI